MVQIIDCHLLFADYSGFDFQPEVWGLEWQKGATNTAEGLAEACKNALKNARPTALVSLNCAKTEWETKRRKGIETELKRVKTGVKTDENGVNT